jgi:hypothetical protein
VFAFGADCTFVARRYVLIFDAPAAWRHSQSWQPSQSGQPSQPGQPWQRGSLRCPAKLGSPGNPGSPPSPGSPGSCRSLGSPDSPRSPGCLGSFRNPGSTGSIGSPGSPSRFASTSLIKESPRRDYYIVLSQYHGARCTHPDVNVVALLAQRRGRLGCAARPRLQLHVLQAYVSWRAQDWLGHGCLGQEP